MKTTSERRYRALLVEQERSGLSVAEFARRRRVPPSNLYWWRKRLRAPEADGLIPVRVVQEGPARLDPGADGFELLVREGLVLRIPPGFDSAELRRLLETLARPC